MGVEIAESEIRAALTTARHHAGTLISLGMSLRDRLPDPAPFDLPDRYCCRTCASSTIGSRPTT